MIHIFFNPTAGTKSAESKKLAEKIGEFFKGEEIVTENVIDIEDKPSYLSNLTGKDRLIIAGGDGTLNRFINSIEDKEYPFPIYCYSAGTGNDFIYDIKDGKYDGVVEISEYIKNLPTITVLGKSYKFINGIGYGIDGFCCEEGDKFRQKRGKAPNYTVMALKGLIYKFRPTNAKITVDGNVRYFKKVWMAPTMNGRYFGGGMMITPTQDRKNTERKLSVAVVHDAGRFTLLSLFRHVFRGTHLKFSKIFEIIEGKDITVEFDRPTPLQIDGETVSGVTEYQVKSAALLSDLIAEKDADLLSDVKEEKEAALLS